MINWTADDSERHNVFVQPCISTDHRYPKVSPRCSGRVCPENRAPRIGPRSLRLSFDFVMPGVPCSSSCAFFLTSRSLRPGLRSVRVRKSVAMPVRIVRYSHSIVLSRISSILHKCMDLQLYHATGKWCPYQYHTGNGFCRSLARTASPTTC